MSSNTFMYPNVTSVPSRSGVQSTDRNEPKRQEGVPSEFDQVLDTTIEQVKDGRLNQVRDPLKFSAHATQRLQERNIKLDAPTMQKVNDAIDRAASKGVEDTLVLTKDAALIVSVKNRTIITAVDRDSMNGNVFTNIDGAVII